MPSSCVVLVPSGRVFDTGVEESLAELSRLGYPVWRVRDHEPGPETRDRMVADALIAGFSDLLFVHPAILFDPGDVDRMRHHPGPIVCGVYPLVAARAFACQFLPDSDAVRFGRGGGPLEVAACSLGFALIRRSVFDSLGARFPPSADGTTRYFTPDPQIPLASPVSSSDASFCGRVRACGMPVIVDTSIRLWHVGLHRYGWEDVAGDRDRTDQFTVHVANTATAASAIPAPRRSTLRDTMASLPAEFPHLKAFVVTYATNADSLALTLESLRTSDWGEEPVVITQPPDWPIGRESAVANYQRALEAAAVDGCDFALILEDDVRVNRHLRHNLLANPLVARDQCDYLGLFIPDLIADAWERTEPPLGYRLAKPRYTGPNARWEKHRVWGSQALLLSRRLIRAALDGWDRYGGLQDARVLAACGAHDLPLWYTAPCLVEHAPLRSAFDTPSVFAPDFDPDFRLEPGSGFQPPEAVPGSLTRSEAELLWQIGAGRSVLEWAARSSPSTVCLAQSAWKVVSVGHADPIEAAEWLRRFGRADRVTFVPGHSPEVLAAADRLDLVVLDGRIGSHELEQSLAVLAITLAQAELLAIAGYPDPADPHIRRILDDFAHRHGWRRIRQVEYLAVFQRTYLPGS